MEPAVAGYQVGLPPASLEDLRTDAECLLEGLEKDHEVDCNTIDFKVLRGFSPQLRS